MNLDADKKYDRPVFRLDQPDDSHKVRPLPAPAGTYPYRMELERIVKVPADKYSFHMVGDTGGTRFPDSQQKIAEAMCRQTGQGDPDSGPAFLYHLGDIVYHYGEAEQYGRQFFTPYQKYGKPVFAIAGNHDSDVNPDSPTYKSLDAFSAVFCDTESRHIDFDAGKSRKSMVQPNIYWTLQTPLATIIGLHSNVPKYGWVGEEQRQWLVEELKAADRQRPDRIIIVCLHHAPYSADVNHGSSLPMMVVLEAAFEESGIRPDIVFSGHVHNYQRFCKTYPDKKTLPFIVCGAGGFDELHSLAGIGDPGYSAVHPLLEDVHLQAYCDDSYGFLRITMERKAAGISLLGEYFTLCEEASQEVQAVCRDRFEYLFG